MYLSGKGGEREGRDREKGAYREKRGGKGVEKRGDGTGSRETREGKRERERERERE